jgi:hypothetical protein
MTKTNKGGKMDLSKQEEIVLKLTPAAAVVFMATTNAIMSAFPNSDSITLEEVIAGLQAAIDITKLVEKEKNEAEQKHN